VAWYGETPVAEQTLAFWQEVVTAHARQIASADGVVA
jgi:hypothetical protein